MTSRVDAGRACARTLRRVDPPAPSRLVEFRKLAPSDRGCLESHLLRLAAADRQMRFCTSVSDRSIRAYCGRIDWRHATVLGCFVEGELRGVAELVSLRETLPFNAELALTVETPFQDQGIGTRLLHKILVIARNRYIATVHMICLLDNGKMRHIARKSGASLVVQEGQVEGEIRPPWPTYLSYIEEAALDGQALFRASFTTSPPAPARDAAAAPKSA